MLTLNGPIEKEVLTVLFNVQDRLQRCEIRDRLLPKYEGVGKKYAKGSFDVVLQRTLDRLRAKKLIEKDYVERDAFYFIPDKAKNTVETLLLKDEVKEKVNQSIDEMNLVEIRAWLSRFEEHGLRLKFTDATTVRDENGKIKGKAIGIGFESLESGIFFTFTVQDKDGRKLHEIEIDKDGKMRRLSSEKERE